MATFKDLDVKELAYNAAPTSSGDTVRATYTCPTLRRAIIKLITLHVKEAGTINSALIYVQCNSNVLAQLWNDASRSQDLAVPCEIVLIPGAAINLRTLTPGGFTLTGYIQLWEYQ